LDLNINEKSVRFVGSSSHVYHDARFRKRKVYQTYILIEFSWLTLNFTLRKTVFSLNPIWQTVLGKQKLVSK